MKSHHCVLIAISALAVGYYFSNYIYNITGIAPMSKGGNQIPA